MTVVAATAAPVVLAAADSLGDTALTALVGAAGVLLLAAGAAKAADPSRTVGAFAALGRPVSAGLVRAGAIAEVALGAVVVAMGGRVPALLVGVSFAAFAGFVALALRSRTPVGTCGCFGRRDTAPHPLHVALNLVLAAAAVGAAMIGTPALLDAPAVTWLAAPVIAVLSYLVLAKVGTRPGSLADAPSA